MHPSVPTALLFLSCAACAVSPARPEEKGPVRAPAQPVEVRLQMVEAPAGVLATWIDLDRESVKLVAPAVADEMLVVLRKEGRVASRPSNFVQPGATATFSTTSRVALAGAHTSDGKPLEEGSWVRLTPHPVDDGRIDVACSIQTAVCVRQVQDAQGTLPVMHEEHFSSRVTLAPDQAALLLIDRRPAPGANVRCVLLRVRPAAPDRIQRL
jgi:hypothetical protein